VVTDAVGVRGYSRWRVVRSVVAVLLGHVLAAVVGVVASWALRGWYPGLEILTPLLYGFIAAEIVLALACLVATVTAFRRGRRAVAWAVLATWLAGWATYAFLSLVVW
jgi:hypothetical protein